MNQKIVQEALVEMFNRIYKTPVNMAKGLPPVSKGDLERWALAIAEVSPPASNPVAKPWYFAKNVKLGLFEVFWDAAEVSAFMWGKDFDTWVIFQAQQNLPIDIENLRKELIRREEVEAFPYGSDNMG